MIQPAVPGRPGLLEVLVHLARPAVRVLRVGQDIRAVRKARAAEHPALVVHPARPAAHRREVQAAASGAPAARIAAAPSQQEQETLSPAFIGYIGAASQTQTLRLHFFRGDAVLRG